jgi:hypothetical protein
MSDMALARELAGKYVKKISEQMFSDSSRIYSRWGSSVKCQLLVTRYHKYIFLLSEKIHVAQKSGSDQTARTSTTRNSLLSLLRIRFRGNASP